MKKLKVPFFLLIFYYWSSGHKILPGTLVRIPIWIRPVYTLNYLHWNIRFLHQDFGFYKQGDVSGEAKVWTCRQDAELFSIFLDLQQLTVNKVTIKCHVSELLKIKIIIIYSVQSNICLKKKLTWELVIAPDWEVSLSPSNTSWVLPYTIEASNHEVIWLSCSRGARQMICVK